MEVIRDRRYTYYVNPNATGVKNGQHYHGTIHCKSNRSAKFEIQNIIDKASASVENPLDVCFEIDGYIFDGIRPKKTFEATAYCFDEDVFDVESGKKIAREKVIKKYLKYKNARIKSCVDYLNYISGALNKKIK